MPRRDRLSFISRSLGGAAQGKTPIAASACWMRCTSLTLDHRRMRRACPDAFLSHQSAGQEEHAPPTPVFLRIRSGSGSWEVCYPACPPDPRPRSACTDRLRSAGSAPDAAALRGEASRKERRSAGPDPAAEDVLYKLPVCWLRWLCAADDLQTPHCNGLPASVRQDTSTC